MNDRASRLFDKPGYIPLKEYVEDIERMRKNGPWKLSLGIGDRIHLSFLSIVARFSWFSDFLHIAYPEAWSPAYSILLAYLRKRGFFDEVKQVNTSQSGHFFYFIRKNILINDHNNIVSGQGIGRDKATALSKALGEQVERMISGMLDMNQKRIIASPTELTKKYPVLYPPKYHRFLEIQKRCYRELHRDSSNPIVWVQGMNLITKEKTYIPRQITSWFFGARSFKDVLLSPTSNGCAGYFTKTGAVLRGLLEVVHRDAFLVHWLTMIPPRVITQSSLPEEMQEMIREFAARGIVLHILDVTALPLPSVYIVAINTEADTPQVVLSGASATSIGQAIHDALEEMVAMEAMFHMSHDLASSGSKYETEEAAPFISDINKTSRQLYWRGAERVRQFGWFISGKSISYDEARRHDIAYDASDSQKLQACLSVLKKLGSDYYPIVYRPKNVIQEELGFFIAQVYIPKAFPLYLQEYCGTFDSDRLQEFALLKNVPDWHLNPSPHMFS